MFETLFQRIPRCLFEPIAVLALIGWLFFLCRHWKTDKAGTCLFGGGLLFMIAWRLAMPINSDRYALILIPFAIFLSLYAIEEIIRIFRSFFHIPGCQLFWGILLIACLIKSFYADNHDRNFYEMIRFLKTEVKDPGKRQIVAADHDLSYFLGDSFELKTVSISEKFDFARLPAADYYLLKLRWKQIPEGGKAPGFADLKTIRMPNGKSVFVLWKKEKSAMQTKSDGKPVFQ